MDLDNISTDQLEAELKQRKQDFIDKEKEKQIILATATLKHDLFNTNCMSLHFDDWLMTTDEIHKALKEYCEEILSDERYKKGTKFTLRRLPLYDNEELWFEVDEKGNDQDLIEMSLEWGRVHLENVEEVHIEVTEDD